jgi:dTDP-4-amino-4,6-dideoxygalactose transaminase
LSINVTKTFLPPLEEFYAIVKRAWENEWLTNRGELVLELEDKLKQYLGTDNILITNNGTIPLQIALKLLAKQGEVITTPFSYVATASSIIWENCKPVFADIDATYLTINENLIEQSITEKTTAILATHVYGNPCNTEAIKAIADRHGLKVIYDAAHCFGVNYNGRSIFSYGDISTTSFHATKLFHTAEGGAIFCNDRDLFKQVYYSHNFGHNGPHEFHGLGINGKISELQAAMGLAVLPYMQSILEKRKTITEFYNNQLLFKNFQFISIRPGTEWNYSYYPVIFESETHLLAVQAALNENDIFPRRYFFPSLNTIPYIDGATMPVSESIAKRVLCLPLSANLEEQDTALIVKIVNAVTC